MLLFAQKLAIPRSETSSWGKRFLKDSAERFHNQPGYIWSWCPSNVPFEALENRGRVVEGRRKLFNPCL